MSGIWRRFASVACRSGRAASLEASTAVASLGANPSYGSSATRGFTHRGSGSERWLAACATQGLGRGFAARGFRTQAAVASDASDASDASNAASGGNVDYYSVKPTRDGAVCVQLRWTCGVHCDGEQCIERGELCDSERAELRECGADSIWACCRRGYETLIS